MEGKLKKLLARLLGLKPEYRVVELSTPRANAPNQAVEADAIATLASHPGFVALQRRLGLFNQSLRTKLISERHTDLASVNFLQAGVYWSGWLDEELKRATTKFTQPHHKVFDEELEAFKALDAQLERVGM